MKKEKPTVTYDTRYRYKLDMLEPGTIMLKWVGIFLLIGLALELLRTVVDAKTPSETEAVPLVTTVFRVLQRSEQCRKCAKYLTYLLRRLSVFSECGWGE